MTLEIYLKDFMYNIVPEIGNIDSDFSIHTLLYEIPLT